MDFKTFVFADGEYTRSNNSYIQYFSSDGRPDINYVLEEPNNQFFQLFGHSATYIQYWIWKNCDLDYYGFCKNDRILSLKSIDGTINEEGCITVSKMDEEMISRMGYDSDIDKILRSKDIFIGTSIDIMTKKVKSVYSQYKLDRTLDIECLDCTIQTLEDLYPEYKFAMEKYIDGSLLYRDNLFIMCDAVFKDYCNWMFSILKEVAIRLTYGNRVHELKYNVDRLADVLLGIYVTNVQMVGTKTVGILQKCFFKDVRTESQRRFKMFVSCHKDCKRVIGPHLEYLHVGAFKGPFDRNMLRDDIGDNISDRNNTFCELTGQYWVWKNCDYDYYGFCHYRRFFSFSKEKLKEDASGNVIFDSISDDFSHLMGYDGDVNAILEPYDIIVGVPYDTNVDNIANLYWQYKMGGSLYIKDLDCMMQVLSEKYPDYVPAMESYIDGHLFYPCNMFIMKNEVFKEYSEWLFDILFEVEKRLDYTNYSNESMRVLGHLGERLLGIYVTHVLENGKYSVGQLQRSLIKDTEKDLFPIEGSIPILLSCNDYYVPYLGSTILSLSKTTYSRLDIIVMNRDITETNINFIRSLLKDLPHISIRFLDVSSKLNEYPLATHEHISLDTFSRLLIPVILKNYDKIIYLDSDLIVMEDITKLYSINLGNNILAGVIDIGYVSLYNGNDKKIVESANNTLNLSDPYRYINAGVLVINVKRLCEKYPGDYLINYASEHDYMYMDQDIINKLFEGEILHLDQCWNTMHYHSGERKKLIDLYAPRELAREYMQARKNPHIIHYAGRCKPWNNEYEDYAKEYWDLISGTLLYNIILLRRLNQTVDVKVSNHNDKPPKPKHRFARWIMSRIDKKYPYPTR